MEILIPADRIRERVDELGAEIATDFDGRPITVVGVLTGCLIFLADLIRRLSHPTQVALLQASSYRGTATTAGRLDIHDELLPDLTGHHVLVLDDILDTGQTISRIVDHLKAKGAASVRTCVLLRKIGRQQVAFEPDYAGFPIPDKFVVGYGLDFNGLYRHLPFIAVLPELPATEA
ncbi:hypoxanthine phosphoribosyltransferase [Limnoglobus roseus]|uniref:Hypoxanthine phosphoribosyltransferase n=1 Tax=Limnoglobus roseus TaxID=2598579 RepID=A0A5C1ANZ6_9BACT|nr:hypoxanthine phosphoribosyltransferase [Limnoglobus roseus]QEL18944.1 hypoxanthine phosphoribosyltransferase [Limnoglobus roseus]